MSNKIKSLVEELKAELEKEYNVKQPRIKISIFDHYNEDFTFGKANKIANSLHEILGGQKYIGSKGNHVWICNNGGKVAEYNVHTNKEAIK